jgi:hypothetical protein
MAAGGASTAILASPTPQPLARAALATISNAHNLFCKLAGLLTFDLRRTGFELMHLSSVVVKYNTSLPERNTSPRREIRRQTGSGTLCFCWQIWIIRVCH